MDSRINRDAIRFYAKHPVQFVRSLIGAEPDALQCQILESVVANKMTSVRSGHGVGKTATLSWLVCWFLITHPHAKVPCTAPTQPTLRDVLWNELAKWIHKSRFLNALLVWTREKVALRGHEEDWYAVARTATKPEALQGFHAQYLMYIIDEASGVSDSVFEPVLGSLSTAGSRLVMCANPTQLSGFFYESHHSARQSYHCITADGRNSSRVTDEYVRQIIAMFGEDSNVFRVRVAGEFPRGEDDVMIPLDLVERSVRLELPEDRRPTAIDIAVDCARFGDDKTVIGYKIDERVDFHSKIRGQDLMRTAHEVAYLGEQLVERYGYGDEIIPVKIDDGGLGGGVTDRLREMKAEHPERFRWMEVCPINFGRKLRIQHFDDTTTYMMHNLKCLLSDTDSGGHPKPVEVRLPNDSDLISQLSTRRYRFAENGKLRIESKDVFKKRAGGSPDEADCVLMLCLPFDRERAKEERAFNE